MDGSNVVKYVLCREGVLADASTLDYNMYCPLISPDKSSRAIEQRYKPVRELGAAC